MVKEMEEGAWVLKHFNVKAKHRTTNRKVTKHLKWNARVWRSKRAAQLNLCKMMCVRKSKRTGKLNPPRRLQAEKLKGSTFSSKLM